MAGQIFYLVFLDRHGSEKHLTVFAENKGEAFNKAKSYIWKKGGDNVEMLDKEEYKEKYGNKQPFYIYYQVRAISKGKARFCRIFAKNKEEAEKIMRQMMGDVIISETLNQREFEARKNHWPASNRPILASA